MTTRVIDGEPHPHRFWQVFNEARDAYLTVHPEPNALDYSCSRCKAQPGEPCRMGKTRWGHTPNDREFHIPRQNRQARAFVRWQAAASNAAHAAVQAERERA